MRNLLLLQQKTNILTRSLFFTQPCLIQASFNSQQASSSFGKINNANKPMVLNYDNIFKQFSTLKPLNSTLTDKIIASKQEKLTNGYAIFVRDQFKDMQSKNPGAPSKEVVGLLAKSWKSMPFEERMTYSNMATENRQALKENLTQLLSNEPQDKIDEANKSLRELREQRRKDLAHYRKVRENHRQNKPLKPRNSYQLYVETLKRGDAGLTDFIKGAAEKWKSLPEQDKEPFSIKAKELHEDYAKNLKEWELKMIESKKLNLVRKSTLEDLSGKLKELNLKGKEKKKAKVSKKTKAASPKKRIAKLSSTASDSKAKKQSEKPNKKKSLPKEEASINQIIEDLRAL